MIWTAYIETSEKMPAEDWHFSAYLGFREKLIDVKFFTDIEKVPVSKWNIVVSYIEPTEKYFNRIGIEIPKPLNIPDELEKYANRRIERMTMGEFKKRTDLPIFVKPNNRSKEFMAGIIRKESSRRTFFDDVPDESKVMTSEPIDIVSEYRGYVINGKLVGLHWYRGDFTKFIDASIVESAVKDYTSAPAGYSIDFALTSDSRTVLIECNDGWSLGNYGLAHDKYANLLMARWLQLTKNVVY